jgi:hypothetical protein
MYLAFATKTAEAVRPIDIRIEMSQFLDAVPSIGTGSLEGRPKRVGKPDLEASVKKSVLPQEWPVDAI